MTLKKSIFSLNYIPSYFSGGLSFRNVFDGRREWRYVLWNNQEIRINNKPVFCEKKKLFEQDIILVNDLLFELDTTIFFTIVSNKISKIIYLIWAGLRRSISTHLKARNFLRSEISLILTIDNKEFDVSKKKSKDYYILLKRSIAQRPKYSKHVLMPRV